MFQHCNKFPLRFNSIYLTSFNSIYLAFRLGSISSLAVSNFFPHPSTEFLPLLPLSHHAPFRVTLLLWVLFPCSVLGTERQQHPLARIQDSPMELPSPFGSISRSMVPGGVTQLIKSSVLIWNQGTFSLNSEFFSDFLEIRGLRAFI